MGILDKLKGALFSEKSEKEGEEAIEIAGDEKICAFCEKPGADKKFAGQYWHKKCLRKARKAAKGMF